MKSETSLIKKSISVLITLTMLLSVIMVAAPASDAADIPTLTPVYTQDFETASVKDKDITEDTNAAGISYTAISNGSANYLRASYQKSAQNPTSTLSLTSKLLEDEGVDFTLIDGAQYTVGLDFYFLKKPTGTAFAFVLKSDGNIEAQEEISADNYNLRQWYHKTFTVDVTNPGAAAVDVEIYGGLDMLIDNMTVKNADGDSLMNCDFEDDKYEFATRLNANFVQIAEEDLNALFVSDNKLSIDYSDYATGANPKCIDIMLDDLQGYSFKECIGLTFDYEVTAHADGNDDIAIWPIYEGAVQATDKTSGNTMGDWIKLGTRDDVNSGADNADAGTIHKQFGVPAQEVVGFRIHFYPGFEGTIDNITAYEGAIDETEPREFKQQVAVYDFDNAAGSYDLNWNDDYLYVENYGGQYAAYGNGTNGVLEIDSNIKDGKTDSYYTLTNDLLPYSLTAGKEYWVSYDFNVIRDNTVNGWNYAWVYSGTVEQPTIYSDYHTDASFSTSTTNEGEWDHANIRFTAVAGEQLCLTVSGDAEVMFDNFAFYEIPTDGASDMNVTTRCENGETFIDVTYDTTAVNDTFTYALTYEENEDITYVSTAAEDNIASVNTSTLNAGSVSEETAYGDSILDDGSRALPYITIDATEEMQDVNLDLNMTADDYMSKYFAGKVGDCHGAFYFTMTYEITGTSSDKNGNAIGLWINDMADGTEAVSDDTLTCTFTQLATPSGNFGDTTNVVVDNGDGTYTLGGQAHSIAAPGAGVNPYVHVRLFKGQTLKIHSIDLYEGWWNTTGEKIGSYYPTTQTAIACNAGLTIDATEEMQDVNLDLNMTADDYMSKYFAGKVGDCHGAFYFTMTYEITGTSSDPNGNAVGVWINDMHDGAETVSDDTLTCTYTQLATPSGNFGDATNVVVDNGDGTYTLGGQAHSIAAPGAGVNPYVHIRLFKGQVLTIKSIKLYDGWWNVTGEQIGSYTPALKTTHNYVPTTVGGNCQTAGTTTFVCSDCGHVKNIVDEQGQIALPANDTVYKISGGQGQSFFPNEDSNIAVTSTDTVTVEFDAYATKAYSWYLQNQVNGNTVHDNITIDGLQHVTVSFTGKEFSTFRLNIFQYTNETAELYVWNYTITKNGEAVPFTGFHNVSSADIKLGSTSLLPSVVSNDYMGCHIYASENNGDDTYTYTCSVCGHVKNILDNQSTIAAPADSKVYKISGGQGQAFFPSEDSNIEVAAADTVTVEFDAYAAKAYSWYIQNQVNGDKVHDNITIDGLQHVSISFTGKEYNTFRLNMFQYTEDVAELYVWNYTIKKNGTAVAFAGFHAQSSATVEESALPAAVETEAIASDGTAYVGVTAKIAGVTKVTGKIATTTFKVASGAKGNFVVAMTDAFGTATKRIAYDTTMPTKGTILREKSDTHYSVAMGMSVMEDEYGYSISEMKDDEGNDLYISDFGYITALRKHATADAMKLENDEDPYVQIISFVDREPAESNGEGSTELMTLSITGIPQMPESGDEVVVVPYVTYEDAEGATQVVYGDEAELAYANVSENWTVPTVVTVVE